MLGKTATFFNRNPTMVQLIHQSNHTTVQQQQTRIENVDVHVNVVMIENNVVHVTMMIIRHRRRRRTEDERIVIGMIIIEGIAIVNGIEGETMITSDVMMMIKRIEIDTGMRGDDRGDRRVERDREVGVGVNRHVDRIIVGVVGRGIQNLVIIRRRSMREPAVKWRIWKS